MYQPVTLSPLRLSGDPVALPPEFVGLTDAALADFSAAIDPPPAGYAGKGLWPLILSAPAFDPASEAVTGDIDLASRAIDKEARTVAAVYVKRSLTGDEIAGHSAAIAEAINAERDRRIGAGFTFGGHPFDYDDKSQKRITGAAALAGFALTLGGKKPGDLRWHDGDDAFAWIAQDNALVPMDAVTCFGLGRAAAAWESAHVFAAKAIKTRIAGGEIIADVTASELWPS